MAPGTSTAGWHTSARPQRASGTGCRCAACSRTRGDMQQQQACSWTSSAHPGSRKVCTAAAAAVQAGYAVKVAAPLRNMIERSGNANAVPAPACCAMLCCTADCRGGAAAMPGSPGADLPPADLQLSQRRQRLQQAAQHLHKRCHTGRSSGEWHGTARHSEGSAGVERVGCIDVALSGQAAPHVWLRHTQASSCVLDEHHRHRQLWCRLSCGTCSARLLCCQAVTRRLTHLATEVLAAKQRSKAITAESPGMATPGNTGGIGSVDHTLKVQTDRLLPDCPHPDCQPGSHTSNAL